MPQIMVIEGKMKGSSFDFEGETCFMGRSSRNDIQIVDTKMSRKHLKIFRIGNKFFIEDLKSTNGTIVNGDPIEPGEGFEVEEGDIITVGNTVIKLERLPAKKAIETKAVRRSLKKSRAGAEDKTIDRRAGSSKDLEMIHKVSDLLRQSLNLNDFFEKVLDNIFESVPRIDTAGILQFGAGKDDKVKIINDVFRSNHNEKQADVSYNKKIVERVIKDGKVVRMSDISHEGPGDYNESNTNSRLGSVICIPMISSSKMRGAIYLDSKNESYAFRKDDLVLLKILSSSVALAIEKKA